MGPGEFFPLTSPSDTAGRWALFRQEGKRKLFHALGVGYAFLYAGAGRTVALWVLGTGLGVGVIVETLRLRNPALNRWLIDRFAGIHRDKETTRPSGIVWTLAGCFLTALLVPDRDIVIAAMLYLTVGDGLAGFVGRVWGRWRVRGKSVEGSAACFFGSWAVGALVLSPGGFETLWGAFLATVVEALSPPPDDNLTIPLLTGLGVYAVRRFL